MSKETSGSIAKSATKILQNILKANVTTLMITHKLTEAQMADQIIVLDQGRVTAQGTHTELLEYCALYQDLWNAYAPQ